MADLARLSRQQMPLDTILLVRHRGTEAIDAASEAVPYAKQAMTVVQRLSHSQYSGTLTVEGCHS
jgi:hypothetical protein